jgi:hypothetical protein
MTNTLYYIHKDDKSPHDPTEYIVLYGEIKDRDDLDEWEYLTWIAGWSTVSKFEAWATRRNHTIPDDFPIRTRKYLS